MKRKLKPSKIKPSKIAERIELSTAFIATIAGLFLISPNFTGNVIGNSTNTMNILGVALLIIGFTAAFSLIKSRK